MAKRASVRRNWNYNTCCNISFWRRSNHPPGAVTLTELWNGYVWTEVNDLNTAR